MTLESALASLRGDVTITSPAEVNEKINDIRKAALAGFEGQEALTRKLDELQAAVTNLAETAARAQRPEVGTDDELRHYIERDAEIIGERCWKPGRTSSAPVAYVGDADGAVRVRGVFVKDGGYQPGIIDDTPRSEWQRELQELVEVRSIVKLTKAAAQGISKTEHIQTPQCDKAIARHLAMAPKEMRIFSQAAANSGAEWIPENYMPTLVRELEVAGVASRMFNARNFPAADVLHLPYLKGHIRPFKRVIPTADDPSNDPLSTFSTDENLITMISHVTGYQIDRDSSEDSLIAVAPIARERLLTAMVNGESDTIWNGDTTGTQDALATWNTRGLWGTGTFAQDHRKNFDGLRKKAFAKGTTLDYASLAGADQGTSKELIELLKLVDVSISTMAGSIVIAVSSFGFFRMLKYADLEARLTGTPSPIVTGSVGPNGTGLPGQVGTLYGIYPIVMCPMITDDLNASGVYDNVNKTKSVTIAVSRARYDRWIRKNFGIEAEVNIRNNSATLVARHRSTFAEQAPSSENEANVAVMFNVPTV